MERSDIDRLVAEHLEAEMASDHALSTAQYTNDVHHDVVGSPLGPLAGKQAAQGFYEFLFQQIHTEEMEPTHRYDGADFSVQEHLWSGTVPGEFMGVPGHGRRISFRILHVWEFRDGLMSRENVWLDGGAIVAQLSAAPSEVAATV